MWLWLWDVWDSLVVLLVDDVEDVVFIEGEFGVWVLRLVVVEGLCDCDVGHGGGVRCESGDAEAKEMDDAAPLFAAFAFPLFHFSAFPSPSPPARCPARKLRPPAPARPSRRAHLPRPTCRGETRAQYQVSAPPAAAADPQASQGQRLPSARAPPSPPSPPISGTSLRPASPPPSAKAPPPASRSSPSPCAHQRPPSGTSSCPKTPSSPPSPGAPSRPPPPSSRPPGGARSAAHPAPATPPTSAATPRR